MSAVARSRSAQSHSQITLPSEVSTRSHVFRPGFSSHTASYAALSISFAVLSARRGDYAASLNYIEKAVDAGEQDTEHFEQALEFAPLREHPKFRTLLARMGASGKRENGS